MRNKVIKFRNKSEKYSIFIGDNTLNLLPKKIKSLCPKTKKIGVIVDNNLPTTFKKKLKQKLRGYEVTFLYLIANEKNKSLNQVNLFLNDLLSKKLNRSMTLV